MSASLSIGPPQKSAGSLFFESQFRAVVQWPPKDTNIEGKVAIVTGSTGGLGLESCGQLLSLGLSGLIIAVRSKEKGERVASEFRVQYPKANIQVWLLEMESYKSVQAFARRADSELVQLDIAILNAGVQAADFSTIPSTGHEKLIQVNYLSTMLLAILLLPVLKSKSSVGIPGRLSIVSSGTARGAVIAKSNGSPVLPGLDDKSRPWCPFERYAVSKLLAHLFIINLVRYVDAGDVVINLVDPGLVKGTDLQSFAPLPVRAFFYCFKVVVGRKLSVGASTYVDATVIKGKETHGCIVSNWKISPFAAFVYTPKGEAIREQLWKETMAEFEFAKVREILNTVEKR